MVVAMEVDNGVVPTDLGFVDDLHEPWRSIVGRAIPAIPSDSENQSTTTASTRLERLEMETRSQLFDLLKDPKSNNIESMGEIWKVTLDICHHLVYFAGQDANKRYSEMAPRKLPLLLIEDCLDGLTLSGCKAFWKDYIEPALDEVLLGALFWESSKVCHLQFLRVCNQFLNRLEPTDSEWKGRIMMSLAKAFPIADPSAKKLWGHFHTSNATDFETEEEFETATRPASLSSSSTSSIIDYNLYQAFWSLQSDFSNPNSIQLADFIKKMKLVLNALESASSGTEKGKDTIPSASSSRYLTSSTLLVTQLDSVEFRSTVITQFLIITNHLSAESPSLANALSTLVSRAKKVLQKDNPELCSVLLDSILSDKEVQWRKWKKIDKCSAAAFAAIKKTGVTKGKKRKRSLLDGPLGTSDEKSSDQYEILGKKDLMEISQKLIKTAPTLESHLEDYVDALDPESGIEEEYHPKNDSLFTWRAMRLYAKHQLPRLKKCREPADLEKMTREWYKEQGKEIPGEMPSVEEDSDDESIKSESNTSDKNDNEKEEDDDEEETNIKEDDEEMKETEEEEDVKDGEDESVVKEEEKEGDSQSEEEIKEKEEEDFDNAPEETVPEDDEKEAANDEMESDIKIEEDQKTESPKEEKDAIDDDGDKKEESTLSPPGGEDKSRRETNKRAEPPKRGRSARGNDSRGRDRVMNRSRGRNDDRNTRRGDGSWQEGRRDDGRGGPRGGRQDERYDDGPRGRREERYDDGGPRGGRRDDSRGPGPGPGPGPRGGERRDDRYRNDSRRGGRESRYRGRR